MSTEEISSAYTNMMYLWSIQLFVSHTSISWKNGGVHLRRVTRWQKFIGGKQKFSKQSKKFSKLANRCWSKFLDDDTSIVKPNDYVYHVVNSNLVSNANETVETDFHNDMLMNTACEESMTEHTTDPITYRTKC